MKQLEAVAAQPPRSACGAWQNVELRHLRYFVAVAEAGSFTDAAERMFIAQPTLSQQLRRLEDIIGTRLLDRRRASLGGIGDLPPVIGLELLPVDVVLRPAVELFP
jgi:Bacterial regulatory helix-turn-helix protein, lysR family